jgi:hypothetical protein
VTETRDRAPPLRLTDVAKFKKAREPWRAACGREPGEPFDGNAERSASVRLPDAPHCEPPIEARIPPGRFAPCMNS